MDIHQSHRGIRPRLGGASGGVELTGVTIVAYASAPASLADFSLLGPIYAHFFRDPVAGFELRTTYPLVTEWVERTNSENCTNARRFGQSLYKVNEHGELISYDSTSDNSAWLDNDEVPITVDAILNAFFEEMWPYLCESIETLKRFINSDAHSFGDELPRKTFTATPGFEALQTGKGSLTTSFTSVWSISWFIKDDLAKSLIMVPSRSLMFVLMWVAINSITS